MSSQRSVDPIWTPAHAALGGSNPLNLTKTLPSSIIHEAESSRQQVYIPLDDDEPGSQPRPGPSDRSWPVLASALNRLRGTLDEVPRGEKLATRVVINELGSVDWGDVSAQVSGVTAKAVLNCNRCLYPGRWNRR